MPSILTPQGRAPGRHTGAQLPGLVAIETRARRSTTHKSLSPTMIENRPMKHVPALLAISSAVLFALSACTGGGDLDPAVTTDVSAAVAVPEPSGPASSPSNIPASIPTLDPAHSSDPAPPTWSTPLPPLVASTPISPATDQVAPTPTPPSLPSFTGDRAVLTDFYLATNGPKWNRRENWLSDAPLGQWWGVTTDSDGSSTALTLPNNGLSGSIPAGLGNLSGLTRLDLSENALTGAIPPQLGKLHSLRRLNLRKNELTGPIPPELGDLTSLESMSLYGNELAGSIPGELGNLSRLTGLVLGGNNLTGSIPEDLEKLSNLTGLSLDGNELSGSVPGNLGNLSRLVILTLDRNYLEGVLPLNLTELVDLQLFDFGENPELCAPTSMENWLEGIEAHYSGAFCPKTTAEVAPESPEIEIPGRTHADTQRAILTVFFHDTGGPCWTQNRNWTSDGPLRDWHGIHVDDNGQVVSLSLAGNNLTGHIPPELGSLDGLVAIELYGNGLSGPIPPELGDLRKLYLLDLSSNELTGEIPPELGNLSALEVLFLARNNLSGGIPAELVNLHNLAILELSENNLSGEIPASLTVKVKTASDTRELSYSRVLHGRVVRLVTPFA